MDGFVYGKILKPMVLSIGTWNPLLQIHASLLKEMTIFAKKENLSSVVVLLHPNPSTFIQKKTLPLFDDLDFLIELITSYGIDAIILTIMKEEDLNLSFPDIYTLIERFGCLKSLWISENQTIGRGTRGSTKYIKEISEKSNFKVNFIQYNNELRYDRNLVQKSLNSGDLSTAVEKIGRNPIWKKPKQHFVKVTGWRPGTYSAIPLDLPFDDSLVNETILVQINGFFPKRSFIEWPSENINWLKFIQRIK